MLTRLYSTPWWFIWREIAFCVLGHIFQLMWSSDQKPVMYGSVEGICCLWLINCLCSLRTDYRTLRNLIFPICCKCFCMVDQDWLRMFGSSSIVWHGFVCMSCSSWLTRVTEYLVLNYVVYRSSFPDIILSRHIFVAYMLYLSNIIVQIKVLNIYLLLYLDNCI